MASSSISLVFGMTDGSELTLTVGPYSSSSTAITGLKARAIAFNSLIKTQPYNCKTLINSAGAIIDSDVGITQAVIITKQTTKITGV